ncbi:hypothetical protein [Bermanella sp. R86510]|uniref:hypothetical protein n=1 Tax=unclassified Bermanella TaxID=2627862 RepID=UPI0037C911E4
MKNTNILILFLILSVFSYADQGEKNSHAGTYKLGGLGLGVYKVFLLSPLPEENYYSFVIEIMHGAPGYNSGAMTGKVKINDNHAIFESKEHGRGDYFCKWDISFDDKGLTINTIEYNFNCGFGNGVIADDFYKKTSSLIPESYNSNIEETRIYYFE